MKKISRIFKRRHTTSTQTLTVAVTTPVRRTASSTTSSTTPTNWWQSHSGWHTLTPVLPPLPVEQRVDTFMGFKNARLQWDHNNRVALYPLAMNTVFNATIGVTPESPLVYDVTGEKPAICLRRDGWAPNTQNTMAKHPSPDPTGFCLCGYNAWKEFGPTVTPNAFLSTIGRRDGLDIVALRVELYGRVLVAERGFRASHQIIHTVMLANTCTACPVQARYIVRDDRTGVPRCPKHARGVAFRMTLGMLSSQLGTEVVFADIPRPGLFYPSTS